VTRDSILVTRGRKTVEHGQKRLYHKLAGNDGIEMEELTI
jgi:hypothetical protein